MKNWYYAVCDKCGEAAHVMVTNPIHTITYLEEVNKEITQWLSKHYGCELRMIHRDDQLDALWAEGYEDDGTGHSFGLKIRKTTLNHGQAALDEGIVKDVQSALVFKPNMGLTDAEAAARVHRARARARDRHPD